jgi:hypothetical protein
VGSKVEESKGFYRVPEKWVENKGASNERVFLEVSQEAGAALFARNIPGEVVMLNLLRFRDIADYSANPELIPRDPYPEQRLIKNT